MLRIVGFRDCIVFGQCRFPISSCVCLVGDLSGSPLQGLVGQEWPFRWTLPLLSKGGNCEAHFMGVLFCEVLLGSGSVAVGKYSSGHLHWRAVLLGDSRSVIQDSLAGIWHCLRISALFVLWKLHCKYVFDNEVSSLVAFCQLWREEVHMQLLAKGHY
jgi:hypothetical protein